MFVRRCFDLKTKQLIPISEMRTQDIQWCLYNWPIINPSFNGTQGYLEDWLENFRIELEIRSQEGRL